MRRGASLTPFRTLWEPSKPRAACGGEGSRDSMNWKLGIGQRNLLRKAKCPLGRSRSYKGAQSLGKNLRGELGSRLQEVLRRLSGLGRCLGPQM